MTQSYKIHGRSVKHAYRKYTIYETFKSDPMVKWKESIKKVVGIPPVERAGMDT
jgi:hypothetical protein